MRRALCLVILVAAGSSCSSGHRTKQVAPDDAARLLIDRNWIDVMPQSPKDRLHVFRFVPTMGGGVFQDRTLYRGEFELFMFEAEPDAITFTFPETSEQIRSAYTIEDVDGPAPFDLKLTIARSPRGPSVYYGMRRETSDFDARIGAR
jgi:hypothetical protein